MCVKGVIEQCYSSVTGVLHSCYKRCRYCILGLIQDFIRGGTRVSKSC